MTIIIESSIADRAIQFIGFTAGCGHIWTVPVSSGQGGQVCLGQPSAKTYGLSRCSYEVFIFEIRSLIFVMWSLIQYNFVIYVLLNILIWFLFGYYNFEMIFSDLLNVTRMSFARLVEDKEMAVLIHHL